MFSDLRVDKNGAEDVLHQRLKHPFNSVFDLLPSVGRITHDFLLVKLV